MDPAPVDHPDAEEDLLQRAARGDGQATNQLLTRHEQRLKQMVRLRLNRHLQGRVDESDVVQEALLEASKLLRSYLDDRKLPFYLWLRHITLQRLTDAHRRHLGAQMRDAGREISLHRGGAPEASSAALAAQLLGRFTSPSQQAMKAELRLRVQEALDGLDPDDREVLVLRHFEHLSNQETAEVLGITSSGASSRYLRALQRMRAVLAALPGGLEM